MKKKLMTAFTLLSTAAACSALPSAAFAGAQDPAQVYQEASQKTSELSSLEVHTTIDMNLAVNGETSFIPVTCDVKMEGAGTEDMKMEMITSMNVAETPVDLTAYYTDGYYYMDSMGTKIKYAMDLAELEEQISGMNPQMEISAEDFTELEMEETEEGTVLTFTISGDTMNSSVDSALGALSGILGSADMDMDMSDIQGSVTVSEDGYITSMNMKLPLTFNMGDEEVAMDMNMIAEYVDPGQEVTVELPSLDDYEEVDLNALADAAGALE